MVKSCLKCGSKAELLLNLVCCSSPRCQNFDRIFFNKWLSHCGRSYLLEEAQKERWKFLGNYVATKRHNSTSVTTNFDLYAAPGEVIVKFGDGIDEGYIGNLRGAPIGILSQWWSDSYSVDDCGKEALLEAAARASV
jgi:hypothetical protein